MNIDQAKERFSTYLESWNAAAAQIQTEADARFKMIDVILTEILGWERSEIDPEERGESGYVDYLFRHGRRNYMVVEAKRSSEPLVDTKNPQPGSYKLGGPALQSAADGIRQARAYCIDHSVQFAGLTNGFQWIGFLAIRLDGIPYNEGKAVVFPTLESIASSFATFHDLFSREGHFQRLYLVHINKAEGVAVQAAEKLMRAVPQAQILKLPKSPYATELAQVFTQFFSDMSGDNDPDMIAQCFVESKESKEADISLHKITTRLINSIQMVESGTGDELKRHIEAAVESHRGEFVLIVGNKGSGKSTFIERFFRLVLPRPDREKCLVIKIDMGDSPGDKSHVAQWITARLIKQTEEALFANGLPEFNDLKGIFFRDYQRWQRGEYKYLYESDGTQFHIRFGSGRLRW